MRISNLKIENYRNIKKIDIKLENITTFIGKNNSGKSNILRAITLPFLSNDVGYNGKNLSWFDINNSAKEKYYKYIFENQKSIIDGTENLDDFAKVIPKVVVEVMLEPLETEIYFVKDLSYEIGINDHIGYGITYNFFPKNVKDVLMRIKEILESQEIKKYGEGNISEKNIDTIKMNLLPIDLYTHSIEVPKKKTSISYDTLKLFKYTSFIAERDNFSQSTEKLGSKSLVKLLHMKLNTNSKITVEKEYTKFFETLKNLSDMDNIINWQENSEIKNARDFFDKISILPNMPNMNSLLNSIKLGYSGEHLSSQGLGHRNLILLLVLLNSFMEKKTDTAFSVITLEEPEAHLCINNQKLIASYMNTFSRKENSVQLLYSTHSTEFVNKLNLYNIIIVSNGNALSLSSELTEDGKDYLSKNPNLDLYKLFLSTNCILVEGLTDELFIRAYFNSIESLNDIDVISFHKGYTNIMDIWLKLNEGSEKRLGIVRDFDNQYKAKIEHEKYNSHNNICVRTTEQYTLEPEIVNTGNNFLLLKKYFEETFNWTIADSFDLTEQWKNAKSEVMLQLCKDISNKQLTGLKMPRHIQEIIDFLFLNNQTEIPVQEATSNDN